MRISDWSSDVCSSDLLQPKVLKSGPRACSGGLGCYDNLSLRRGHEGQEHMGALQARCRADDPGAFPARSLARPGPDRLSASVDPLSICSAQPAADHLAHPAPVQGSIAGKGIIRLRSEEHTSELQSLMRNSYAVFCL